MSDLMDFTEAILPIVAYPSRRKDVVPIYATAILYEVFARPAVSKTRWSVVNDAIIDRWSVSGLVWIKTRAWKHAQAEARKRSTTEPPK
jgi:hypothetical protein